MERINFKSALYVICGAIIAIIFFFIGRATINKEGRTIIEYVELPPIHDTITEVKPSYIIRPADTANIIMNCIKHGIYAELFPNTVINDTVYFTKADTSEIMADWATSRYYTETLFNIDTIGECVINEKVQYNRIDSITYTFKPIQKTVTKEIYKTKAISPYIGVGWGTTVAHAEHNLYGQEVKATAGLFIKEKYGVSMEYEYDYKNNNHSIGGMLMYKF